jgi:STE24 endopeptidase
LAHEIGHYKKKHVWQMLSMSIIQTGFMLFLLSLMINNLEIAKAM